MHREKKAVKHSEQNTPQAGFPRAQDTRKTIVGRAERRKRSMPAAGSSPQPTSISRRLHSGRRREATFEVLSAWNQRPV